MFYIHLLPAQHRSLKMESVQEHWVYAVNVYLELRDTVKTHAVCAFWIPGMNSAGLQKIVTLGGWVMARWQSAWALCILGGPKFHWVFTRTLYRKIQTLCPTQVKLLVKFSCLVVFASLWPHGLQHARAPSPSPTLGVYSNLCPLSQWCHPTISSTVVPFSSCLQPFPASWTFPVSQFFASGGQILEFHLQHQSFQWIYRTDFL